MSFRTFGEHGQETPMSPPFSLTAHDGRTVRRFDYKQRMGLLIVFLDPADATATDYARDLVALYPDCTFYDTQILVILAADDAGVADWVGDVGALPFPVLADPQNATRARYLLLLNPADHEPAIRAAVFATDRYAALHRYGVAATAAALPNAPAILEVLVYLNSTCDS